MQKISIQIKIFIGIILILFVSVSLSIVISVVNQRNALLENSQRSLLSTNEVLNTVIRNIMLDGEAPIAVSTMEGLQEVSGIDQLQIYTKEGKVAFSDYETLDFVNEYQSMMMFQRTPRQETQPINVAAFNDTVARTTPTSVENLDEGYLEYFFPIINTADCRVCHGSDHLVRGVAYYRVSLDRVLEQIAQGRNTLILFFLGTGVLITLVLVALMRKVVVQPVQALGHVVQTVGQGNLDVRSDIQSRDEFGLLSQQINTMISGLKERNRLQVENTVIETRNRENQKYLDNIGEGLLLINRDRTISQQYSTYLTHLFNDDEIAGRKLSEFLFPDRHPEDETRKEIDEFIDVMFDSLHTEMDMIMSINPLQNREIPLSAGRGDENIVVDTAFYRIMSDDPGEKGNVENVMVIFTDQTGLVRVQQELAKERQRSEDELSQIAAVLRIGPQSFREFIGEASSLVSRLEQLGDTPPDARLLGDLHSLKGTARYLNFTRIGSIIHDLEDRYADSGSAEELLHQLEESLQGVRDIQKRFLEFSTKSETERGKSNVGEFQRAAQRMSSEILSEMEKKAELKFRGNVRHIPGFQHLRPHLIHLLRNSLDHGIEEIYERVAAGKDEQGTVEFIFSLKDGQYKFIVADDGSGIDFDSVKKRAVNKGLIENGEQIDEQRLIRLIFSTGFSTRDEASDLSGRGVGLDAVHRGIQELGGKISVYTRHGEGTHFTIVIPARELEKMESEGGVS